ncbi:hypothetical protein [Thioclava sp. GXIMD2076]|uniref:PAS fold-4 domain-containing protein n=1 Tax=Thioclava kandeliae TaxID=3070818 RepID=A0ABV1SJT9_9RHOB
MLFTEEFTQNQALPALSGHLQALPTETALTSAIIIDRERQVVAAHRQGLALPDHGFVEKCSRAWRDVLMGVDGEMARNCVDLAFSGQRCAFETVWQGPGYETSWSITLIPLKNREETVSNILVCATRLTAESLPDPQQDLQEIAHTLANITTVIGCGAKMLRRNGALDESLKENIAAGLEDSAQKAEEALIRLRQIIGSCAQ